MSTTEGWSVDDGVVRINSWSGPRNISTAFMYSFRQRADCSVVDEPLYAHYLVRSGVTHPGGDDVIASQSTDADEVIRTVLMSPSPTPVRFYKQMAHHLDGVDPSFLGYCQNILLIRDPREMLPSLSVQLDDIHVDQTGLPNQVRLLDEIVGQGATPVVLDSKVLLQNPPAVLSELCARLGITFDEAMLSWPPGPKPEDGVWATHWYDNVHASTGFAPYRPKSDPFPGHLEPVLAEAQPLYDRLAEYAIRV